MLFCRVTSALGFYLLLTLANVESATIFNHDIHMPFCYHDVDVTEAKEITFKKAMAAIGQDTTRTKLISLQQKDTLLKTMYRAVFVNGAGMECHVKYLLGYTGLLVEALACDDSKPNDPPKDDKKANIQPVDKPPQEKAVAERKTKPSHHNNSVSVQSGGKKYVSNDDLESSSNRKPSHRPHKKDLLTENDTQEPISGSRKIGYGGHYHG